MAIVRRMPTWLAALSTAASLRSLPAESGAVVAQPFSPTNPRLTRMGGREAHRGGLQSCTEAGGVQIELPGF